MKKIIFFDMDGTLLYREDEKDQPVMSTYTKEILKAVQEKGHLIFVATGRPYAFLDKEIVNFGFDGFVLANGAVVIYHDKLIHHVPLEASLVKQTVESFEEKGIQYVLQTQDYSYFDIKHKELESFYDRCAINYDMIKREFDPRTLYEKTVKIEMLPTTKENIEYCQTLENEQFNIMGHPPFTFELYARNTSKATGIECVLEAFNILVEDSYAFGDGKNDIEMLQKVGTGIAMGNAPDDVKEHADMVCLSVDQEGVAKKLKELFLD